MFKRYLKVVQDYFTTHTNYPDAYSETFEVIHLAWLDGYLKHAEYKQLLGMLQGRRMVFDAGL